MEIQASDIPIWSQIPSSSAEKFKWIWLLDILEPRKWRGYFLVDCDGRNIDCWSWYVFELIEGGNTFNHAIDKGTNAGYAIGQGIGSEISFKLGKIAKAQSLRDVICEAESIDKKIVELNVLLRKTSNQKKRNKIKGDIQSLKVAKSRLTGMHDQMKIRKGKTKEAMDGLISEVLSLLLMH
jgi:hypothetical protein